MFRGIPYRGFTPMYHIRVYKDAVIAQFTNNKKKSEFFFINQKQKITAIAIKIIKQLFIYDTPPLKIQRAKKYRWITTNSINIKRVNQSTNRIMDCI